MEELKPCPFCGSSAERKTNKRYRTGFLATVGCKSQLCPAKISQATLNKDVEEAYKYATHCWNRRVSEVSE